MNRRFSVKFASLALLIVMLLNPVIALAGSLSSVENLSDQGLSQELMGLGDPMVDMSSEHCHDSEALSSKVPNDMPEVNHDDCCEDVCKCSQTGCHPPLASIGALAALVNANSPYALSTHPSYLSPSLSSLTPPPIS